MDFGGIKEIHLSTICSIEQPSDDSQQISILLFEQEEIQCLSTATTSFDELH